MIPTFHLRQATSIFGIAIFLYALCAPVSANSALTLSLPATQQTEKLVSGNAQKEQCAANRANWCETANETLWMGRSAHCDYGFYVLLPEKFVGHGNISLSPIHGFLVGLSDRSTTSLVRIADQRFVWVNAEYNSLEAKFSEDAADSLTKPAKELLARDKILLKGKPATRFKIEYGAPKRKMIEQDVVALRSGILLGDRSANYIDQF